MRSSPETKLFVSISARPGRFGATVYSALFERFGIDAVYLPRLAPPEARQITDSIRALAIDGCSVSSPHKSAVISTVDSLAPSAETAGAVNTIVRGADGRLTGHCTDVEGVRGALAGRPIDSALIYGGGGVVGPAIGGLRALGAERVAVCSRNQDQAEQLAERFDVTPITLEAALTDRFDVLINATPCGRVPADAPDLFRLLARADGVLDMPVNERASALLDNASSLGLWTRDGVEMCVHQIAAQANLYLGPQNGRPISAGLVREIVRGQFLETERGAQAS